MEHLTFLVFAHPSGAPTAVIRSTVEKTSPAMSVFPFPNSRSHPNPPVSPCSPKLTLLAATSSPMPAGAHPKWCRCCWPGESRPCKVAQSPVRSSSALLLPCLAWHRVLGTGVPRTAAGKGTGLIFFWSEVIRDLGGPGLKGRGVDDVGRVSVRG